MTGTLSPSIPTIGEPNSTEDSDVRNALISLRDGLNAILNNDNTVMGMQNYRNIFQATGGFAAEFSTLEAGKIYLLANSKAADIIISGATSIREVPFPFFYFDDADYLITGKTLKMRLRSQIAVNGTKPTIKFTVGLYPISSSGGAEILLITAGSVVSGSTIEFNEPAASTITQNVTSDFTIPSDGAYALGVTVSGDINTNSQVKINTQVQVRNL